MPQILPLKNFIIFCVHFIWLLSFVSHYVQLCPKFHCDHEKKHMSKKANMPYEKPYGFELTHVFLI